ncbi:hypothetical protein Q7C36_017202 [Tachysurus vachellii]|uniref:Uncharacterized protein n=1 Tax=Tachysurus vachellii TaxID=175792 RepID=A0AA88M2A5_TACVA|nr:hypothetical protein Q7C36_017202 [Tachysurus vachellii]
MSESKVGNADTNEEENPHPWPHIGSMFTVVKVRESSYIMRCLLCLPKQIGACLSFRLHMTELSSLHCETRISVSSHLVFLTLRCKGELFLLYTIEVMDEAKAYSTRSSFVEFSCFEFFLCAQLYSAPQEPTNR